MKTRSRGLLALLVGLALVAMMAAPAAAFAGTVKMKRGGAVAVTLYSDSSTARSAALKAPGKKAAWKSTRKGTASVSAKGKVTARKPGRAVVTARTSAGTFKCNVTVKKVSISKKSASIAAGGKVALKLNGEKVKAAASSDASVATVTKKGVVTGVAGGTAKITLTGKNKKKYTCSVTVIGASAAGGGKSAADAPSQGDATASGDAGSSSSVAENASPSDNAGENTGENADTGSNTGPDSSASADGNKGNSTGSGDKAGENAASGSNTGADDKAGENTASGSKTSAGDNTGGGSGTDTGNMGADTGGNIEDNSGAGSDGNADTGSSGNVGVAGNTGANTGENAGSGGNADTGTPPENDNTSNTSAPAPAPISDDASGDGSNVTGDSGDAGYTPPADDSAAGNGGTGSEAGAGGDAGAGVIDDTGSEAGNEAGSGSNAGGTSSTDTPPIETTSTVATQAELAAALNASTPYETVTISTQDAVTFDIEAKELGSTTLVIDAPSATVSNAANFKVVQVRAIAKDTYRERAKNRVEVAAPESHIVIEEGATAEVVVGTAVENVVLENAGTIRSLDVNTEGSVEITGDSEQRNIPTTVRKEVKISTKAPLIVEALAKAVLYLQPGSEGTEVSAESAELAPEAFGMGNVKMTVANESGSTSRSVTVIVAAPDEKVSEGVVEIEKVQGKAVNSKGEPLAGARAYLVDYSGGYSAARFKAEDSRMASSVTDNDGVFSFPKVKAGNYNVVVVNDGYENAMQGLYLSNVEGANYCPDSVLLTAEEISAGKGGFSGRVVDGAKAENDGIEGITVRARPGQDSLAGIVARETKTSTDGSYVLDNLDAGVYTLEVVDERVDESPYVGTYFTVVVAGGEDSRSIPPTGIFKALEEGQVRFVLSWDDSRSGDLDAHLVGPAGSADDAYSHVYYGKKEYAEGDVEMRLDRDNSSLYASHAWYAQHETITISKASTGTFEFYVHNASELNSAKSNGLAMSSAKVGVYSGARLLYSFNVPSDLDGTLWKVCSYDATKGALVPANEGGYEDSSFAVGSDRRYGSLGIKEVSENDFVKYAKVTNLSVFLQTTGKLAVGENTDNVNVTPLDSTSTVTFREPEKNGDPIQLVVVSPDGRERSYDVYNVPDAGLGINGLVTNEVITSASVHSDAYSFKTDAGTSDTLNYINITATETDFEKYRDFIKVDTAPADAECEILFGGQYPFITLTSNGYSRQYRINVSKDWSGLRIESIMSKSPLIRRVKVDDHSVMITGTKDKFTVDDFETLLDVNYGSRVQMHELMATDTPVKEYDDPFNSSAPTPDTSVMHLELQDNDASESFTYYVYYSHDWDGLSIESIDYEDTDFIEGAHVTSDAITVYLAKEVPIEDVFKMLKLHFETEGISGELSSSESGYLYIITGPDSGSRTYRIVIKVRYPDGLFATVDYHDTEGTDFEYAGILTGGSYIGDESGIELRGNSDNFEDLIAQALDLFRYGDMVETKEIIFDGEQQVYKLVLTSSSGIQRNYVVRYYPMYTFDNAYIDDNGDLYVYTGSSIGAEEVINNIWLNGQEMKLGSDYEVSYQKYDNKVSIYSEASITPPSDIGQYRMILTPINALSGEKTFDYEIIASNSLRFCRIECGTLYMNSADAPAFAVQLYDADSNIIGIEDYSWIIKGSQQMALGVDDITQEGFYDLVVMPTNDKYTDSITHHFEAVDARDLSKARIKFDENLDDGILDQNEVDEYQDGMIFGVNVGKPSVIAVGTPDGGKALDDSHYTVSYYEFNSGRWVEADTSEVTNGYYKVEIVGKDSYCGTARRTFTIDTDYDPASGPYLDGPHTEEPTPRSDDKSGKAIRTQSLTFGSAALAA